MFFASDNGSGVAPEVMAALAADRGYARAYGADEATEEVTALVRTEFDAPEAEVVLVASGTAANALALSTLCPPWGVVFCREGGPCRGRRMQRGRVLLGRGQARDASGQRRQAPPRDAGCGPFPLCAGRSAHGAAGGAQPSRT